MEIITLEEIKVHLRLDDITAEDTYLTKLGNRAEGAALKKINRTIDEVLEMDEYEKDMFGQLALMFCESMYDVRGIDDSVQHHVTPAAASIACSLRKLEV